MTTLGAISCEDLQPPANKVAARGQERYTRHFGRNHWGYTGSYGGHIGLSVWVVLKVLLKNMAIGNRLVKRGRNQNGNLLHGHFATGFLINYILILAM